MRMNLEIETHLMCRKCLKEEHEFLHNILSQCFNRIKFKKEINRLYYTKHISPFHLLDRHYRVSNELILRNIRFRYHHQCHSFEETYSQLSPYIKNKKLTITSELKYKIQYELLSNCETCLKNHVLAELN